MMKQYTIKLQPELCCEECYNVIHNHFDCPVCNIKYAGTTIYGDLEDCDEGFCCEECGAEFIIPHKDYNYDRLVIYHKDSNI